MGQSINVLLMRFNLMDLRRLIVLMIGMCFLMLGVVKLSPLIIRLLRGRSLIILLGVGTSAGKISFGELVTSREKCSHKITIFYQKHSSSHSITKDSRQLVRCMIKITYGFKNQWHHQKVEI